MFGTFRLLLATGVVIAHMGISIFGVNTGITSVICFFMVSGYAMSGLIEKNFPGATDIPKFYVDRILRIGPQYYFYLLICMFTVLALGWRETAAQTGSPDLLNMVANVSVIPLTFWMFSDSIGRFMLNMPTWSLGLELCFYLVLPLLLLGGRAAIWVAAALGAIVWTLSTHNVIDPDFYSYRLLPGTLVFFLVGVAAQRRDWPLFALFALFFVANLASLWWSGLFWLKINPHLLIGAGVGCVMIPVLARLPKWRFDDVLGGISYGMFLSHWIFITILKSHYGSYGAAALAIAGSMTCGALSYWFIERPAIRFRHALRRRRVGPVVMGEALGRA
jgi:peptidoglycan/LPS O-acetylase OafA/YrhL